MTVEARAGVARLPIGRFGPWSWRDGRAPQWILTGAWLVVLGALASRSLIITLDSMSNYAHVWWVAEHVRHGHHIPFRMQVLGHGEALSFPYGAIPWVFAASLWPLLGEHSVSVTLVLGAAATIGATFWSFPELRRGWWAAATLANPLLVMAPIAGQLPFLWAAAMLLAALGMWRKGRRGWALVLATLAQVTHPVVLGPITLLVVVLWLPFDHRPRRLITCWVTSALITIPAAVLVVLSPVTQDTPVRTELAAFIETFVARAVVIVGPMFLVWVKRREHPNWAAPALFVVAVMANFLLFKPMQVDQAWRALVRKPDTVVTDYTKGSTFEAGITYRVLRAGDAKVGMYQMLRAGARLDSEFFPESINRRSWPTANAYLAFLAQRKVERVMIFDSYDQRFRTNEHQLLDKLTTTSCADGDPAIEVSGRGVGYTVYAVSLNERTC
jgi:hypothetical protein